MAMNLRRLTAAAVGAATLVGAGVATAAPANAISGCSLYTTTAKSAIVTCSYGPGEVRAAIGCTKWFTGTYVYTRYGPWVGPNQPSQAQCRWDEQPRVTNGRIWHWYEQR
jgi:hypothetical protein